MNLVYFREFNAKILTLLLIVFCVSCGEDFTDDYNKLKKEYDQLAKEKEELTHINEKLKGDKLELVKESQNTLVTNFVTNIIQTIDDDDNIYGTEYHNVFEEGKLAQTIVKKRKDNFSLKYGIDPFSKKIYTHTYNEAGLIIKSTTDAYTIDYGWQNQNCVSIILTQGKYVYKYTYNINGLITNFKASNYSMEYVYNANEDIKSTKRIDEDGTVLTEFAYNDDKTLKQVTRKYDGVLTYQKDYNYENNLFTHTTIIKRKTGEFYSKETFSYNADNLLVKYFEHQTHSTEIKRYVDIEYTNKEITKYIRKQENFKNNLLEKTYHKIVDNIVNYSVPEYPNYQNNRYDAYEDYFKSSRRKTWTALPDATIKDVRYYVIENLEERKDDYYHQTKSKLSLNEDGTSKEKTTFSNWFTEEPYAPKKKEIIEYVNNQPSKTTVYTNNENKKYSIVWTIQE